MNFLHHVLRSWRSLRASEALVFVSAALLFGAIDLTSLLELRAGNQLPQVLARQLSLPLVSCAVLLLCWLPATRSSPTHPRRRWRLVAATLVGSALAMAVIYPLAAALPWPSLCDLYAQAHGKPRCTMFRPTAVIGDTLWIFMPALMLVGMLEFRNLRRRQDQAAQDLLREHSQLRRHALAARLAALQAQVDPALLFDALVAVEQAYGRQDPGASARLERLIRHLRVALPRLRDAGATLGSEAELIASYLDLLRDLGGTPPAFECALGARGATPLPPMLLLPLVQRAVRLGEAQRCWLKADGRITLGFDQEGLCNEDADLAALRERLDVLDAKLACHSGDGRTEFTLELP
ncbi:histidine kinase [Roseateles sp.]|uniref:histidine kinase n=1 Tax=Roseateles sp. TaxID=1971397 RepID=UPI0025DD0DAD|nr:histidine kinase [Roseateles sp.]MBV8037213.1 histidine kinase [Roseateles sp.]